MNLPGPKLTIPLLILLIFATRLPQLASPYMLLDGDECVVGLMAKHIYDGKEFPLFFWGQQYGFTLIECLFILPFYALLGINAVAVKLAMLSLWTIGVIYLYKTLQLLNKGNTWLPFLLILVFAVHPAWAIWSMKARGGYITAFTVSNIILYLCFKDKTRNRHNPYFLSGLLLAIVYESQPFWLAGILPLVLYKILSEKTWEGFMLVFIPACLSIYALSIYKTVLVTTYTPSTTVPGMENVYNYISRIPGFLYTSMHGNYYLAFINKPNFFCAMLACMFSIFTLALPFIVLLYCIIRRRMDWLLLSSIIFIPFSLGITFFTTYIQARYLLPVLGFTMLPLQLLLNKVKPFRWVAAVSSISVVAGIIAVITFWNFEFYPQRRDTIFKIIGYLNKNEVKYVFCTDLMTPWHINFYSGENITARMPYTPERYPPNTTTVNKALDERKRVAFVCFKDELHKLTLEQPRIINDFGVGLNPSKKELADYAFIFTGVKE